MENSRLIRSQVEAYLRENRSDPITEQPNRLTTNIDLCETGAQIVELLHRTDREIIDGWVVAAKNTLVSQGLKNDQIILDKLTRLSNLIHARVKSSKPFKVVISGCGTSGRIAYLCSQTFNDYIKRDICAYTIAGGDWALVNSVESVEDRPDEGVKDLIRIMDKDTDIVYIGITCGLSAPYVAGQLSYCMDEIEKVGNHRVLACALIGFNPIEMARRTQIINSRQETFADLLARMNSLEQHHPDSYFIITPLIGPEPITGSSRMKSGTTTKILLDVLLSRAIEYNTTCVDITEMIECYERVMNEIVYSESDSIGRVIDQAAVCLRSRSTGGSVNYLAGEERFGFMACVDASECVPTYGASRDDIKGFLASSSSDKWSGFIQTCHTVQSKTILDNLDKFDSPECLFVIIEYGLPKTDTIIEELTQKTRSKLTRLCLLPNQDEQTNNSTIKLVFKNVGVNVNEYFRNCLQEFGLKLVLNAISTAAHVLIGKTYENIMVDVRVSNIKLFYRAIGILRRLGGGNETSGEKEEEEYEECLLKSIYGDDLANVDRSNISGHIEKATGQSWVVPRALFMVLTKCSAQKANEEFRESNRSVRNCIFKLKNKA